MNKKFLYFPDIAETDNLDTLIAKHVFERYNAGLYIINPGITENTIKDINEEYSHIYNDCCGVIGVGFGAMFAQLITDSCNKLLFDPIEPTKFFNLFNGENAKDLSQTFHIFKNAWDDIDLEMKSGTFTVITPFNNHNGYHSRYFFDTSNNTEFSPDNDKWIIAALDAVDNHLSWLSNYYSQKNILGLL